jgi:hypothetical protein
MTPQDPFSLYTWVAQYGFPGAMGVLLWLLYTRRLHWHAELEEIVRVITEAAATKIRYLEERVKELVDERNRLFDMATTGQRAAAKSMDVISEQIKKDK